MVRVAELLGIQYREALFGFEEKAGRKFPTIGGIVVFDKDVDIITSALDEIETQTSVLAAQEKQREVLKKWRKIVNLVCTRNMLRERHGA